MRRPVQTLVLAIAGLGLSATAVMAATAGSDSLTVGLNESRRIMLHGAAANVIVGDPKVADVAMVDTHSVIIMGKGYGATPLIITDRTGRTLLDSEIMVAGREAGRLTLYRGTMITNFSCTSTQCHALQGEAIDNGFAPPAAAAPAAATPASAAADQPTPHP
jgi:Flp pilus assembly secretin CpaC